MNPNMAGSADPRLLGISVSTHLFLVRMVYKQLGIWTRDSQIDAWQVACWANAQYADMAWNMDPGSIYSQHFPNGY